MRILKVNQSVQKAVLALKKGEVVIFPTDTVYGFLADAENRKAVEKIFTIKKRAKSKPLSLFITNIAMAKDLAEIDALAEKNFKKYWPGRYTFVVKRKKGQKIYGVKKESIALRIPKHRFLQSVLKRMKRPLVQTSVNVSSKDPLNRIDQILREFGSNKKVGLIVDGGNILKPKPSKIIDISNPKAKVLRK